MAARYTAARPLPDRTGQGRRPDNLPDLKAPSYLRIGAWRELRVFSVKLVSWSDC